MADAQFLVDKAMIQLRLVSVGPEGRTCSAREESVASRIVEGASQWQSDAIVLGSRRPRGISRSLVGGQREHPAALATAGDCDPNTTTQQEAPPHRVGTRCHRPG